MNSYQIWVSHRRNMACETKMPNNGCWERVRNQLKLGKALNTPKKHQNRRLS